MHVRTNLPVDRDHDLQFPWPPQAGTQPWALAAEMSADGGSGVPGTSYDVGLVDPDDRGNSFDAVVRASEGGSTVPIYVGDDTRPGHVTLVTASEGGDTLSVYDPSNGSTITVSRDDWVNGTLDVAGWSEPWFAWSRSREGADRRSSRSPACWSWPAARTCPATCRPRRPHPRPGRLAGPVGRPEPVDSAGGGLGQPDGYVPRARGSGRRRTRPAATAQALPRRAGRRPRTGRLAITGTLTGEPPAALTGEAAWTTPPPRREAAGQLDHGVDVVVSAEVPHHLDQDWPGPPGLRRSLCAERAWRISWRTSQLGPSLQRCR